MDHWHTTTTITTEEKEKVNICYKAYFSTAYKEDETIIKQITGRIVTPTNPENKLIIAIYYKSRKKRHLRLRNIPQEENMPMQESHVMYWFTCE